MTRLIQLWAIFQIEERTDGWWFKHLASQWVGPYPSFASMSEQLGNFIERKMIHEYRRYYGQTPR
jgi:hypothetical protein